jgi:uncharacterized protein YceH (UPF0502 family)
LDAVEVRVLGCLIEKQRTTPDVYPLSLNALRVACNQSTNRDPVVRYDEATIREGMQRLSRRRWARLASGMRTAKYRHLLDETLGMPVDQQALLAVLMLRGPQTPGELRQRTERLYDFGGPEGLETALAQLIDGEYVQRLARRPGQKEERYAHRLSEDLEDEAPAAPAAAGTAPPARAPTPPRVAERDERLERLEQRLEALAAEVADLRARVSPPGPPGS